MVQLLILLHVFFVGFTDKTQTGEPALSPRAIDQRAKWSIPTDELDYPVNAQYLSALREKGVYIYHTSRWFNGATCEMTDEQAQEFRSLSFVRSVEMTRIGNSSPLHSPKRLMEMETTETPQKQDSVVDLTRKQLEMYNLLPLHEAGYKGHGILMTICDGGFNNVNTLSCYRQEQELGHFDFTDDTGDFYGYTGDHGMYCLSAISAISAGYQGAATSANYYLMRTEEYATESPKEMDNLVAALEKRTRWV